MNETKPETKQEAKPQEKKSNTKKILLIVGGILLLCICSIVILVVVLGAVIPKNLGTIEYGGGNTTPTVTNTEIENYGTVENDNPTCSLPKVNYKANAFSIGVPKGWLYSVESGTVSIKSDETNTTAAFLYTAKINDDTTPAEFIEKFSNIFNLTIKNVGGTYSLENITSNETFAQGDIKSTIGSDVMEGLMKVELDGGFVTLRSYWAPKSIYQGQKALLEEVVGCFARTKILTDDILSGEYSEEGVLEESVSSGLSEYKGRYFSLLKPSNFNVTAETDSGIDTTRSDGSAGFSYAYATGFTGSYTPKTWAEKALPQYAKISNLSLSNEQNVPSNINGQVIKSFDFTGLLNNSISVRGKTTVGIYSTPYIGFGDQWTSAFWGIQIATPAQWAGASATLQQMQDSITIIDIGSTRKNTLLPPNRPMEDYSGSSITSSSSYSDEKEKTSEENWADGMRGYESVTSPSTGQSYDVPLNSWSSYGPEGPGYYRQLPNNSLEKLQ